MALRLHVVTGKGGTGKTTLACALAIALADEGRRVLLCEVEGRQGLSRLLGTEPLPYAEVEVAEGAGGGTVTGLAVEPRAALLEYLDTFHAGPLGPRAGARTGARASAVLDRAGAVDVIATVAPGLRDVLLVGKVYEAALRTTPQGAPVYDAVVLDAPPTGRITRFLSIGDELSRLAAGGPVAARAAKVDALLRSEQTAVHLVSLPEELPVTETVEAATELRAAGLSVGAVVANRLLPALPEPRPAAVRVLRAALRGDGGPGEGADADAGDDGDAALADALLAQARSRVLREREQQRWLDVLRGAGPVRGLPDLPAGVGLDGLYELADHLVAEPLTAAPEQAS